MHAHSQANNITTGNKIRVIKSITKKKSSYTVHINFSLDAPLCDAERSQQNSDNAHADNARAEGKVEKLLACVQVGDRPHPASCICNVHCATCLWTQTQIECFVAPLSVSYSQLGEAFCNALGELGLTA